MKHVLRCTIVARPCTITRDRALSRAAVHYHDVNICRFRAFDPPYISIYVSISASLSLPLSASLSMLLYLPLYLPLCFPPLDVISLYLPLYLSCLCRYMENCHIYPQETQGNKQMHIGINRFLFQLTKAEESLPYTRTHGENIFAAITLLLFNLFSR